MKFIFFVINEIKKEENSLRLFDSFRRKFRAHTCNVHESAAFVNTQMVQFNPKSYLQYKQSFQGFSRNQAFYGDLLKN